jgi:hypothetical protein
MINKKSRELMECMVLELQPQALQILPRSGDKSNNLQLNEVRPTI